MRKLMSAMVIIAVACIFISGLAHADLDDGLRAHWSFNNCDGTDDSGNGHDGVVYGTPACESRSIGNAFRFGTAGDFVRVSAGHFSRLATGDFSVVAWFNLHQEYDFTDPCGTSTVILRKMNVPGTYGGFAVALGYNTSTGEHGAGMYVCNATPHSAGASLGTLELNRWYMLSMVYEAGEKISIYLDGAFVEELYFPYVGFANYSNYLQIGQKPYDNYCKDLFPGLLDEIRIYNRTLHISEIRELFNLPPHICHGQDVTILGTEGNDIIIGSFGPDVIHGLGSVDIIRGMGGDDIICGGDGSDYIGGVDGNDIILGGDGHDAIWGGPGNDMIHGEEGHDIIFGGPGNDDLDGHEGHDVLSGMDGNDLLEGGWGNDCLYGGDGIDILRAGAGPDNNDTCYDVWGTSSTGCEVFYEE